MFRASSTAASRLPSCLTHQALPPARRKALKKARRTWPQAQPGDFERDGKLYVDRPTGTAYRSVPGDPQLGGAQRQDVAVFFVTGDGHMVYLREAGNPGTVVSQDVGEFGGRAANAREAAELHHVLQARPV